MNNFTDLRARSLSAAVLAVLGLGALWLGGVVFGAMASVLAALMAWELHRMIAPELPESLALSNGLAAGMLSGAFMAWGAGWVPLVALAVASASLASRLPRDRVIFGLYMMLILTSVHSLFVLREDFGLAFVLWLVAVVIASDVAGYFAGRTFGGPKFWPRISPKKTWSGTVAGWVLSALVGVGFVAALGWSWVLVPLSVLLAFAGQMGDIAESAIKRHEGVKDSSHLIPGHGGVLDRFDAMMAVAALALLMHYLGLFAGQAG